MPDLERVRSEVEQYGTMSLENMRWLCGIAEAAEDVLGIRRIAPVQPSWIVHNVTCDCDVCESLREAFEKGADIEALIETVQLERKNRFDSAEEWRAEVERERQRADAAEAKAKDSDEEAACYAESCKIWKEKADAAADREARATEAARYLVTALTGAADPGGWSRKDILRLSQYVRERWPEFNPLAAPTDRLESK